VKYAFITRQQTHFPLGVLCRVLGVARSGFHDHQRRQAPPGPDPDAAIRRDLRACHARSRGLYGRPRLVADLRALGHAVGPKRVPRLMREAGLRGRCKGRARPRTTDSRHRRPVVENVLARQFEVTGPTPAWVSDITSIETREGWLYLAVVPSVQTRQVLGYSLAERMPDDLVEQAFLNAGHRDPARTGVVFHSDRSSQGGAFRRTLTTLGFVPSMSRKGNWPQGQLLGQCGGGEFLRDAEERRSDPSVPDPGGRACRDRNLHPRLLQSEPAPLRPWLRVAGPLRKEAERRVSTLIGCFLASVLRGQVQMFPAHHPAREADEDGTPG